MEKCLQVLGTSRQIKKMAEAVRWGGFFWPDFIFGYRDCLKNFSPVLKKNNAYKKRCV